MGPSQIIHRIKGSPAHPKCGDVAAFVCWVCGFEAVRGVPRWDFSGSKFTGQSKVRCPASTHVCEGCAVVMSGRPPDTERMYSHFVEGELWLRVNKGQKPAMREFLRRPKSSVWFAGVADSGQKHIVPWCQLNRPHQSGGRVLFEEALVELPRDDAGWAVLDDIASALTDGATKDEILSGHWTPRAWQLLGERVTAFEARWGAPLRGGSWFEFAVWLAQRDEEKVAVRMDRERVSREAKKREAKRENQRRSTRATAVDDGGVRTRPASRVPADAGVQRLEALGPDHGSPARRSKAVREPRGVVYRDDAVAPAVRSERGQLSLFA